MKLSIVFGGVLALCASTSYVHAEDDVLFRASFDRFSMVADEAQGAKEPLDGIATDLQLRMFPDANGKNDAVAGNALALTSPEYVRYPLAGNFRPDCGTVSFWVQCVNYTLADPKNFRMFFRLEMPAMAFLIYKFNTSSDSILFWMNNGAVDYSCAKGQIYELPTRAHWREGEWHKVDVTWDAYALSIYVDARLGKRIELDPPAELPKKVSKGFFSLNYNVGWSPSPDGAITAYDDVTILNRKLSPAEIYERFAKKRPDLAKAGAGGAAAEEKPRLTYKTLLDRGALAVRAHFGSAKLPKAKGVPVKLSLLPEKGVCAVASVSATWNDAETVLELPFADKVREGENYRVVLDVPGTKIVAEAPFRMPKLDFLRTRTAMDETIPKPWTPIEQTGATSFRVLGRAYDFAEGPFPATTGEQKINAAPRLTLNGKDVVWTGMKVVKTLGDRVCIRAEAAVDGAKLTGGAVLWFDGFVENRLVVEPAEKDGKVDIAQMGLKWAVTANASRYLLTPQYQSFTTGRFDGHFGFAPSQCQAVWLTGVHDGLIWWCESDANWRRSGQADIHVQRTADGAEAAVDLVSYASTLAKRAVYTMGWEATPCRPVARTYRTYHQERVHGSGGHWYSCNWASQSGLKHAGNMIHVNTFEPDDPKGFDKYLRACHNRGCDMFVYGMPAHMSSLEDTWDYFNATCRMSPAHLWSFKETTTRQPYHTDPCCPHTAVADWQIANMEKLLKGHPDIRGLYFDIGHVLPCNNTLHGHGGIDAFGRKYDSSTALGLRQFFLRVAKLCQRNGKLLHVHAHSRYYPFVHAFAEACWPGEERYFTYINEPENYYQEVEPEEYESLYSPVIQGMGIYLIPQNDRALYTQGATLKGRTEAFIGARAVKGTIMPSLIYDFAEMEEFGKGNAPMIKVRAALKPLAMDKALFRGYWFDPVAKSAEGVRVSGYTWAKGEGAVPFLLVVGNFTRVAKPMGLVVDWAKLGTAPTPLKDLYSAQVLSPDALATTPLAAHDFLMLVPVK